jgi:hypothetical protein
MDTNKLKKFATEARNRLKAGIAAKIITLGFDKNGRVPDHMHPQLMQGGSLWNGRLETEGFYHQWQALYNRVQQKGIKEVYEEAAYTWFNRLVAIRILQKNQLIEPVLDYVDQARTPRIVDEARMGRMPQMQERQRQLLTELLDDDSKTTEQFAILVTAFCHENPILSRCFGAMSDYTELLLPNDILTEGGFIDMLNHTEFITDDDFRSPELIGWLYQFYISERKDEVFAKKGKFEADEIPAATQIFTPNWIVKYMVQNTIGRIYLDNNPSAAAEFKPKWQYLVEPSEPTPKESVFRFKELTELLTGDLACGSGHILNECFDLLYDLYIYEGYSRREAIENIFFWNLRGVDLDTRAKQLATFALMLKACQKDASFADAHILPHVLSMPALIPQEQVADRLQQFFRETPSRQQLTDLTAAFELMQDAESLGSIMKFDVAESTLLSIQQTLNYWRHEQFVPEVVEDILPAMDLILTLTDKYAALVMNPPYMGGGNMNETLSNYVKRNYEEGKADLFSTFMLLAIDRLADKGKYGMINMHSWMFLSSFEKLRRSLLENEHIDSLLHLGPRTFDELSGEVVQNAAFVVSKTSTQSVSNYGTNSGTYYRLVDGKNCSDKERMFLEAQTKHTKDVVYPNVEQKNFENIPGFSLGYWVNENTINIFKNTPSLHSVSKARLGQNTGDNERFLKSWYEISFGSIGFNLPDDYNGFGYKWIPYTKGGLLRRWYGPSDTVVNWANDGEEVKDYCVIRNHGKHWSRYIQSYDCFYKSGMVFPRIGSGNFCTRLISKGTIFDVNAPGCFPQSNRLFLLGYLNSKVIKYFLNILCPTLTFQVGDVSKVPCKTLQGDTPNIDTLVERNVIISKIDWNLQEVSWDFEANPLVALRNEKVAQGNLESSFRLSDFVEEFKTQWTERFMQLHQNEEELNRQFISIYGLEDELTPDVPLDEITILQQGEISIVNNGLEWHEDVLMKQLISYAVGVWMGRYKLGQKGLHIAHPNPTEKELQEYWYGGVQVYIDEDGLIPVLPQSSPFDDNLSSRISDFIRITFGEDKLTENLNYIEQKLGMSIDQYVQKDFWKDHKKMYQNRPIYWLFSSKKGAFKCLAYMHRMNAYTAERVRSNYLLPYIEYLQNQIADLENRRASLSTAENRKLQNFQKALDECREYHERLQVIAEQAIAFDLDDGVVVNYAKFGDILAKIK